jgi:hypothetical protein
MKIGTKAIDRITGKLVTVIRQTVKSGNTVVIKFEDGSSQIQFVNLLKSV